MVGIGCLSRFMASSLDSNLRKHASLLGCAVWVRQLIHSGPVSAFIFHRFDNVFADVPLNPGVQLFSQMEGRSPVGL